MKIGIAVSKVTLAISGPHSISEQEQDKIRVIIEKAKGNTLQLDVTTLSEELIDNLLLDNSLSATQRRVLGLIKLGANEDSSQVLQSHVGSPLEFHTAIGALTSGAEPSAEFFLNGRWYPIVLQSSVYKGGWDESNVCGITGHYRMADYRSQINKHVTNNTFFDDNEQRITHSVADLLLMLGLRPLQTDLRDHFDNIRLAKRYQEKNGHTLCATGSAIMVEERNWWRGSDQVDLGTPSRPSNVIIEGEMETSSNNNYYNNNKQDWDLPFVRVFSLDKKRYAYVDVRDIAEREWDENALEKLVLTPNLHNILKTVFDVPCDKLFGDVISGKAGGMIILAEGGPGVGKTLTAEIFAEHTKRPLYVLEMAELGTDLKSVEDNLRRIFRRAARWNAVLLFDEADVFMAKRDDNLERSAIVGVFLRLLDYYKGMLFLTSNRSDVIDPAFKSRITLALKYPDLDSERRLHIWNNMLAAAGITVSNVEKLAHVPLNGRQIRNMVRLCKVVLGDNTTAEAVQNICQYTAS